MRDGNSMPSKAGQLRNLIRSKELEFIMEAHSGISAKIVEEAGFKGIWGSGLSISGSMGVRDNNEASWTQVLDVVEFMSDASSIPILLDGDTGYGNFNNMRRLVKKLERIEVGGVCIEDKMFPKTNSFLRGEAQPLADIDEFCGKIKAGKDSQLDDDFVIVARLEAFIAGWGLEEMLRRAEAYWRAGADALLIHSKLSQPTEIFAFTEEWGDTCPLVIVPTKYYSTPTDAFREKGISTVIWANHLFRGAVEKMKRIAHQIHREENLLNVEDSVVSVAEIFRLQGDDELKEAEKSYLLSSEANMSAVILAAWQGTPLGEITSDVPKAMIRIGEKSILETMVDSLRAHSIKSINVVAGYKKESIDLDGINIIENVEYKNTSQLFSLDMGLMDVDGEVVVMFGDILFKRYILQLAIEDKEDIVIVVDSNINYDQPNHKSDYVFATVPDDRNIIEPNAYLKEVLFTNPESKFDGEWIGMMKLSAEGVVKVKTYINNHRDSGAYRKLDIRDMLNAFVSDGVSVKVQYISGHWIDVDTITDLNLAGSF